jgi:integrase/recombinase XerD
MANREVNLTKRVKTADGLRFCAVVFSANGRVKPDVVLVDGKPEHHNEGAYYIEWYEGARRRRLSVGRDAADAHARRLAKEAELNALNHGVAIVPQNGEARVSLAAAIQDFLEEKRLQRKGKTYADYDTALRYFQQSCPKQYLQDVTRKDLLGFAVYCCEELELSPRTVFNKFARIVAFLKAHKIKVHEKGDAPRFVEEEPEVYEREDLDAFFKACDAEERLWFEFFLMTGMREQEVTHACWKDIKFSGCIVRVSHNPELNWTPNAYKEREIPIPDKLAADLKKFYAKSKGCPLIFPTAGCRPKLDFLDCCKAIAKRAGLNCGHCDGCKGRARWCEHWFLHKFRATFATWSLWAGVDLRTVQMWMGHTDIESTMRYLKPSRSQQTRDKVNDIFCVSRP